MAKHNKPKGYYDPITFRFSFGKTEARPWCSATYGTIYWEIIVFFEHTAGSLNLGLARRKATAVSIARNIAKDPALWFKYYKKEHDHYTASPHRQGRFSYTHINKLFADAYRRQQKKGEKNGRNSS